METVALNKSDNSDLEPTKDREIHLKEWGKARDVLQFYDDKLHDLRKYGFSFITAFITADGILLSTRFSDGTHIPIKFAIFGVTLILILALHLIDKNYRVFQRAAATRALVLEKKLNIELSEIITDRYRSEHINRDVFGVYLLFILGALALGCFSMGANNVIYSAILILIAIIATVLTELLNLEYKYKYEEDWTVSPLESSMDGMIRITINNIGGPVSNRRAKELFGSEYRPKMKVPEPIPFKENTLVWEIISEKSGEIIIQRRAERDINVYDSHTWFLHGKDFRIAGVYQLRPRGWPLPLHRRVIISNNRIEGNDNV